MKIEVTLGHVNVEIEEDMLFILLHDGRVGFGIPVMQIDELLEKIKVERNRAIRSNPSWIKSVSIPK
ncbi:MAG: hypothetical protein KGL39_17195 [Patescibacteria group bacterium]|nr:hypothetical protein [Patescibacteria group bacterium]